MGKLTIVELWAGGTKWGTLYQHQDEATKRLSVEVTKDQIDGYVGGLLPFGSDDEQLRIDQGSYHVFVRDRHGNTRFKLNMNDKGEITDVSHQSVTLEVFLSGPGSRGNDPLQPGTLMFRLRST